MRTLKFISIMLNFEKDFFEKYYYILGHIIILKSFGNNKYYLKILKLDLFVNIYDVVGHSIIMRIIGRKRDFSKQCYCSNFKLER